MLFIVRIEFATPEDMTSDRLGELKRAEAARAAELAREGVLHRLWRDADRWANWGLWEAPDEPSLRTHIATLPLAPYMRVSLHPVVPHPSDPAKGLP